MKLKRKLIIFVVAFLLFGSSGTAAILLTQDNGPQTYKANFYSENAIVQTVETEYDKTVSAPSGLTKDGYEFKGWFEDNQTFVVPFDSAKAYNKDVNFYAKWQENQPTPPPPAVPTYTVKFYNESGVWIETVTVKQGESAVAPTAPEKYGHVFDKWSDDFTNVTKDLVVFATYKKGVFDVLFDDGRTTPLAPISLEFQSVIQNPANADSKYAPTEKDGWNFDGWYFDANKNNKYDVGETKVVFGTSKLETEGATIVANYTKNPVQGVSVNAKGEIEKFGGVHYSKYGSDITLESQFVKEEGEYSYAYLWTVTKLVNGKPDGDLIEFENKNLVFTANSTSMAAVDDNGYYYAKAGNYQITLKITQFDGDGKKIAEGDIEKAFELRIQKIDITISAPDGYRTYGDTDDKIIFVDGDVFGSFERESEKLHDFVAVSGLLPNDRAFFEANIGKLGFETTAGVFADYTQEKNQHKYEINIINFEECVDIENYNVTLGLGSLRIDQRNINFNVDDVVLDYGHELVAPTAKIKEGYTFAGFGTDTVHTLEDIISLNVVGLDFNGKNPVDNYPIEVVRLNDNYAFDGEVPTATYTINPRKIKVALAEQSGMYTGEDNFEISQGANFYNIETADKLVHEFDKGIISITKAAGINVGKYDLIATIKNDVKNYIFENGEKEYVEKNAFEITRRTITVAEDDVKSGVYNKIAHGNEYQKLINETGHTIYVSYVTAGVNAKLYQLSQEFDGENFAETQGCDIVVTSVAIFDGSEKINENNYKIKYNLSIEITKANLNVSMTDDDLSKVYTAYSQLPTMSIKAVDADDAQSAKIEYSKDGQNWYTADKFNGMKDVDNYDVYVKVSANNYNDFISLKQTFKITKADLYVKADDITVVYGDSISLDKYTFKYTSQFLGEDTAETSVDVPEDKKSYFTMSSQDGKDTEYSTTTRAGTTIVLGLDIDEGKLYSKNYNIIATAGKISVEKREVTVTFKDIVGTYGREAQIHIVSVANMPTENNDKVANLGISWSISKDGKEFTATSAVGEYDITIKEVTNSNYTVKIDASTDVYTVKQRVITGVVSGSKPFDGSVASLPAENLFANSQELISDHEVSGVIETANTFAMVYGADKFNTDAIIIKDLNNNDVTRNYSIQLTGSYEITNAEFKEPSVYVDKTEISDPKKDYSFEYDGSDRVVKVVPVNVAGDMQATVLYRTEGTEYSSAQITIKNAGRYTIYCKITADNHEDLEYYFNVEITQKLLTISVESVDPITYGDDCPQFVLKYDGFVYGDNETNAFVLNCEPKASCDYKAKADVGNYNITISKATAVNYKIEYVNSVLNVQQKELSLENSVKGINDVYNANAHYVEITDQEIVQLDKDGIIQIKYSTDNKNWSTENIAFTNVTPADSYLYIQIADTKNYIGTNIRVSVVILPLQVNVEFKEQSKTQTIVYGYQETIDLSVVFTTKFSNGEEKNIFSNGEEKIILNSITYKVDNKDAYPADHSKVLDARAEEYIFTIASIPAVANYSIVYSGAQTSVKVEKQELVASIETIADSYYGDAKQDVIANHRVVYTYNGSPVSNPEDVMLLLDTNYKLGDNANNKYNITFAEGGKEESTNYKVVGKNNNTFMLKKRVGTVVVNSATQVYGDQTTNNYSFDINFEDGFVQPQGFEAGVVATIQKQTAKTFALRNSDSYGVGLYTISVTYSNDNYSLTLISHDNDGNSTGEGVALVVDTAVVSDSVLQITPKEITVEISNTSSVYGQDTGLEGNFNVSDLAYDDQKDDLNFELTIAGSNAQKDHKVSATYSNPNYKVTVKNTATGETYSLNSGDVKEGVANHEITKQQINLSVSTQNVIYGQTSTFTLSVTDEKGEVYSLLDTLSGTLTISKAGMEDVVINGNTESLVWTLGQLLSAGNYTVSISFEDTNNYDVVGLTGVAFTVEARKVNVYVEGSKVYDGKTVFSSFTVVQISAEDEQSIADQFTVSGSVVAEGKDANDFYGIASYEALVLSNSNYAINNVTGKLEITPAEIAITVSGNSMVYGAMTADEMNDALTERFEKGTFVSPDNLTTLNVKFAVEIANADLTEGYANVGLYAISIASWANNNYTVVWAENAETNFTVTQRQVNISAFETTTSTYGTSIALINNSKFTVELANFGNATILDQAIASISYALKDELTRISPAGYYDIIATINSNNFKFVVGGADTNTFVVKDAYQIEKQQINISVSTENITYGQYPEFALSTDVVLVGGNELKGTIAISKQGKVVNTINNVSVSGTNFACTLESILSAGDYTVSINFADTDNYEVVGLTGTEFNVAQRKVNVDIVGSKYYDDNNDFTNHVDFANATITAEDGKEIVDKLSVSGTVFATGKDASETVYGVAASSNLSLDNSNYAINVVTASLTIKKAIVDVAFAAPSQTGLIYGDMPSLDLVYTGFVDEITKAEEIKYYYAVGSEYTAGMLLPASETAYGFTVEIANLANYTFNVDNATATVKVSPFSIELTPTNATSIYGNAIATIGYVDPTAENLTNDWNNGLVLSTEATNTSNVDNYAINVAWSNKNYNITIKSGSVYTITARKVTVSLSNASKVYDGTVFSADLTESNATGLVENHKLAVTVSTKFANVKIVDSAVSAYNTNAEFNIGTPVINDGAISVNNYDFSYELSATITQKQISVQLKDQADKPASTYGNNVMSPAQIKDKYNVVTDDNLVAEATLAISFAYAQEMSNLSDAGQYGLVAKLAQNSNFKFETGNTMPLEKAYTINKKAITYTINHAELKEPNKEYTYSVTNGSYADLVSGHTINVSFKLDKTEAGVYGYEGKGGVSNGFNTIIVSVNNASTNVSQNYDITLDITYTISAIQFTTTPFNNEYDGNAHRIEVNTNADYKVEYSTDKVDWSTTNPGFTQVSNNVVYIRITDTVNDIFVESKDNVNIIPRKIKVEKIQNASLTSVYGSDVMGAEQIKAQYQISLVNAAELTQDAQTALDNAVSFAIAGIPAQGFATVKNYNIVATINNNNFAFADGTNSHTDEDAYSVTKKSVNVTFATPTQTRLVYGQTPSLELSYNGFVDETTKAEEIKYFYATGSEYTTGMLLNANETAYNFTVAIEDLANYTFNVDNATATVKVSPCQVAVDLTGDSHVYSGEVFSQDLEKETGINGETVTFTATTISVNAGNYSANVNSDDYKAGRTITISEVSIIGGSQQADNYEFVWNVSVTIEAQKVQLSVSTENVIYGQKPTFTLSVTDEKGDAYSLLDTLSGTLAISKAGMDDVVINSTTANLVWALDQILSAGDYTVSISFADTNNYDVVGLKGTEFKVAQRQVNVVITGEKEYDGNAVFKQSQYNVTFDSVSGNAHSGVLADDTVAFTSDILAGGQDASATSYGLAQGAILALAGEDSGNYAINSVVASLTITPAEIKITVSGNEMVYGDMLATAMNGALTAVYSSGNLAQESDFADLGVEFAVTYADAQLSNGYANVGEYTISIADWSDKNYNVTLVGQPEFVVSARQITVEKLAVTTSVYGEDIVDPTGNFSVNLVGIENATILAQAKGSLTFVAVNGDLIAITNKTVVGKYSAKATLNNNNFKFAEGGDIVADAYEIKKATLTVKVNASREFIEGYGSTLDNMTGYTVEGWVDGQVDDIYNAISTLIGEIKEVNADSGAVYTFGSHEGAVAATIAQGNFDNYVVVAENGTLKVTQKSVTIDLSTSTDYNGESTRTLKVEKDNAGNQLSFVLTATVKMASASVNENGYAVDSDKVSIEKFEDYDYDIENYAFTFIGSIEVTQKEIKVSLTDSRDYDGDKYQAQITTATDIIGGHTIKIDVTAGTNADSYIGSADKLQATTGTVGDFEIASLSIKDANGTEVSKNYTITYSLQVTITKQVLTATIEKNSKEANYYGDTPDQIVGRYTIVYRYNNKVVDKPEGIELGISAEYAQGNVIGTYPLTFVKTNAEVANYVVTTFNGASFTIEQRALTVNVGNVGHTYGQIPSDLGAHLSNAISYEGDYVPNENTDPQIELSIVSKSRSAQLGAGNYEISVYYTNANYIITFVGKIDEKEINQKIQPTTDEDQPVSLSVAEYVVEKQQINLSVSTEKVIYGQKPTFTLSVTDEKGDAYSLLDTLSGTLAISKAGMDDVVINSTTANLVWALDQILSAGDYTVAINFADTNNYDVVGLEGTEFKVAQRQVNVVITGEKEYDGNAVFTQSQYNATFDSVSGNAHSGVLADDTVAISSEVLAGGQDASETAYGLAQGAILALAGEDSGNYAINSVVASLTINKKQVQISLSNATFNNVYNGEKVRMLTITKDSAGNNLGFALTVEAETSSANVDTYSYGANSNYVLIEKESESISADKLSNYRFSYVGSIKIEKATIVASFEKETDSVVYGQKPELKLSYTGFVGNDNPTITPKFLVDGVAYDATALLNVKDGAYVFTIATGENGISVANGNYTIVPETGAQSTITIEKATIVASFEKETDSVVYGQKLDLKLDYKVIVSGEEVAVSGDVIKQITPKFMVDGVAYDATALLNVKDGAYVFTIATGENGISVADGNYTIVPVENTQSTITIEKATIVASFEKETETVTYGKAPVLSLTYKDIVGNDNPTITPKFLVDGVAYDATALLSVGAYVFTIATGENGISVADGNYTIVPANGAQSTITVAPLIITVEKKNDTVLSSIYNQDLMTSGEIAEKLSITTSLSQNDDILGRILSVIKCSVVNADGVQVTKGADADFYNIWVELDSDVEASKNFVLNASNNIVKLVDAYEIKGRAIEITVSGEKVYDGTDIFVKDNLEITAAKGMEENATGFGAQELAGLIFKDQASIGVGITNVTNNEQQISVEIDGSIKLLTDANYSVAIVKGTVKITRLKIKLVYNTVTKTYDGNNSASVNSANATSLFIQPQDEEDNNVWKTPEELNLKGIPGWDSVGHQNIDLVFANSSITGADTITGAMINAGTYSGNSDSALVNNSDFKFKFTNYDLTIGVDNFVITPRVIAVTHDDTSVVSSTYGEKLTALNADKFVVTLEEFEQTNENYNKVLGEAKAALTYQVVGASNTTNVDFYGVKATIGNNSNFTFVVDNKNTNEFIVEDAYEITPAGLTITLSDATKPYDGTAYITTITTATGLLNGDTISVTVKTNGSDAKPYSYNDTHNKLTDDDDFVVSGLTISSSNANYTITFDLSATITQVTGVIFGSDSENVGSINWTDYKENTLTNIAYVAYLVDGQYKKYKDITITPTNAYEKGGTYSELASFIGDNNVTGASKPIYVKLKTVAVGGFTGALYTFEDALKTATSGEIFVNYPTQTAESVIANVLYKGNDYTAVKAGVTLNLPRDSAGNVGNWKEDHAFAGAADATPKNMYVELLLQSGFVLTNNGTIIVGGMIGAGDSSKGKTDINGLTTGVYAQITMGNKAQIINESGAVMEVYGYVKEQFANTTGDAVSKIIVNSGATIWAPFTVYDFRGGSISYAAYDAKKQIVPFLVYDVSNIHPMLTIKSGGHFRVWADLVASNQHNHTNEGCIVSTKNATALFKLDEGASISFKYKTSGGKVQTGYDANFGYTDIYVDGNVSIGSFELKIKVIATVTINTEDFYFGISYKHRIFINSGTLTVPSGIKIKCLPGNEIVVGKDATLQVDGSVVVYDSYNDRMGGGQYSAEGATSKFTVNGTMKVVGSFAGKITTTEEDCSAQIIMIKGAANTITTYEITSVSGSSVMASATTESVITTISVPLYSNGILNGNGTLTSPSSDSSAANNTYVAYKHTDADGKESLIFYFGDTFDINYIFVDVDGKETLLKTQKTANGQEQKLLTVPEGSVGWYTQATCDCTTENCEHKYSGTTISVADNLYARLQTYTITYILYDPVSGERISTLPTGFEIEGATIASNGDITGTYTVLTRNNELVFKDTSSGYYFFGWYIQDKNSFVQINSLAGKTGNVKVYCSLSKEIVSITYQVNTGGFEINTADKTNVSIPNGVFEQTREALFKWSPSTDEVMAYSMFETAPYYFMGWYMDETLSIPYSASEIEFSTNSTIVNYTLYAKWGYKKLKYVYGDTTYYYYTQPNEKGVITEISSGLAVDLSNLALKNYGTGSVVSVWWTEQGKNTTNYYLPIGETEQELLKDISGLAPDVNGVITLYGEPYYVITQDTISADPGSNKNLMFYGVDFSQTTLTGTFGLTASIEQKWLLVTYHDTSYSGTYVKKNFEKVILDGCSGAIENNGVHSVKCSKCQTTIKVAVFGDNQTSKTAGLQQIIVNENCVQSGEKMLNLGQAFASNKNKNGNYWSMKVYGKYKGDSYSGDVLTTDANWPLADVN